MITRAIGLLIIIGHQETLCKNDDWKYIIDYTINNCEGELTAEYKYEEGHEHYEPDSRA